MFTTTAILLVGVHELWFPLVTAEADVWYALRRKT